MKKLRLAIWGFCVFLVLSSSLLAELPNPRLWTIFPAGAQAGTTVELTVTGADLDGPLDLVFSDPSFEVAAKQDEAGKPIANTFVAKVPSEIRLGRHEVWARGRYGLSNSRLFVVGDGDSMVDSSPSHDAAQPVPLPLGSSVAGRTVANQKNFYRIFAREGQRVVVTCLAEEIDSRLDAVLALRTVGGKLLAKDRRGRLLDYLVGTTEALVVSVHDLTYQGGDQFFYRLTADVSERTAFVLPLSGQSDAVQAFQVYGRNLAGGAPTEIRSTAGPALDSRMVREKMLSTVGPGGMGDGVWRHSLPNVLPSGGRVLGGAVMSGASLAARVGLVSFRSVVEEPSSQGHQELGLPVAVSGMFYPRYDEDVFDFSAEAGDRIWVEVQSHRLGFPTSPLVTVERVEDGVAAEQVLELVAPRRDLGGRTFPVRSWDPQGLLTIKKTGRYRLTISDLFNGTRDEPGRLYQLILREPEPGVRAFSRFRPALHRNLNRRANVVSSTLFPGQVLPLSVTVDRLDGFKGEIEVSGASESPGVVLHSARIPAGETEGIVFVQTNADAEAADLDLKLQASGGQKSEAFGVSVDHGQVIWEVADYNNQGVVTRISQRRRMRIAGGPVFPLELSAGEVGKVWETSVAGVLEIPVKVTRRGEFPGALALKVGGLKTLAKHGGVTIAKDKNEGTLRLDLTKNPLGPGEHRFYLYGETKGKYRREPSADAKDLTLTAYTPPIRVSVVSAPFVLTLPKREFALAPGVDELVPIEVKRRFGFAGQIEVATEVAPKGASVSVETSMLRDGRFDLRLRLGEDAPREPVTVTLTAKGQLNGKPVTTSETLRIQLESTKRATDA